MGVVAGFAPLAGRAPTVDRIRYRASTSHDRSEYLIPSEPVLVRASNPYLHSTKASPAQAATEARKELMMRKFKIEHGASKINLVLLKTNIEDTISQDIDMLASWSNNDRKYIVNELLRFALTQEEDFLKYKVSLPATVARTAGSAKPTSATSKHTTDAGPKPDVTAAHA
jgi:hypothetical protein